MNKVSRHMEMTFKTKWTPSNVPKELQKYWPHIQRAVGDVLWDGLDIIAIEAGNIIGHKNYTTMAASSYLGHGDKSLTGLDRKRMTATVGSDEMSALILEWGRGEGKKPPPPGEIKSWAGFRGLNTDDHSIANISKSISRTGIKAVKPLLKAKDRKWPSIARKAHKIINDILKGMKLK